MEQTINKQKAPSTTKPRKMFVAFLFSLLLPGLGQVYNGQLKKGIVLFCLCLFVPFSFGVVRGTTSFYGLIFFVFIILFLRVYSIIDGIVIAKKLKEYILKPYNTWYFHLMIAVGMLAVLLTYNINTALGTRSFKIPTISSNPTLQEGDWLVADMRAYNKCEPDYGDLIVYSDSDGQMFTFRIVGKPNDNLELNDNIVAINGKPGKSVFIKETTNEDAPVLEFEEELPNGHKHSIYKSTRFYDNPMSNIKDITVPADSYYVLGDNRDNAVDSRYVGFVNREQIKGRILYSYWGKTTQRININFTDK